MGIKNGVPLVPILLTFFNFNIYYIHMNKTINNKSLAANKKAYHEYEILTEYEAGIELHGTEVKSIRAGKMNLKESIIKIMKNEVYLINCHIAPYEQGNIFNKDPLRTRKLLLHRKEINQLIGKVQEKGLTLVATKAYLKGRRIKIQVALAKGKKLYDKRQTIKDKDINRELERDFKLKFK